ncbi:nucleotide-binding protein [Desulfobulbus sp. F4]|nr:nucleotide-binding protein [Desulfobulbus sp. F3]MCW5201150.1 nucleotide-binding protein [Desulfobulbus sp. F4]
MTSAIIRQQEKSIVRDNVVFELGLFIGSLGKERCFILKPRNIDLHLPTDLLGMTLADYEPNRSDGDLDSAVNRACALIKKQMEKLSLKSPSGASSRPPKNSGNILSDLNQTDFSVLEEIVSTATTDPDPAGYTANYIKDRLCIQSYQIDLSMLKLEKSGHIEKANRQDYDGNEFYAYNIISSGIEVLFEREKDMLQPQRQKKEKLVNQVNDVPF